MRAQKVRHVDPVAAGTLYRSSHVRRVGLLVGQWAAAGLLGLFIATAGLVTGVALLVFTSNVQ